MENFVEFVKPFSITFELLNRVHIDIYDKESKFFGKCRFYFVLGPSIISFYLSLWTYASKIIHNEIEFYEMAFIVPVIMVTTQGILKGIIVLTKKAEIRTVIRELDVMWRDDLSQEQFADRDALLKTLRLCNVVFYWMNMLGSWQYIFYPLLETTFRRVILQDGSEFQFPFSCSFPFDPATTWFRYITIYIFEAYSMIHLVYVYLGAEFLMINLCALLSIEFTILRDELLHVTPVSTEDDRGPSDVTRSQDVGTRTTLNDVIKEHQILIKLSKQLNDIFSLMIFINLMFSTITICFFGFVARMARGPVDIFNNFVGVVASILPIFNLCYYGEMLLRASAGMAEASYKNLWYNGDAKYRRNILFIIMRSQKPCCMTSLNFTPVTLTTFSTVLSRTWSYFSLVTSLYEDKY